MRIRTDYHGRTRCCYDRQAWYVHNDANVCVFDPHIFFSETGIAFSDLNNELYTPRELITAAKKVIQKEKFDLDPASCVFANELHIPPIAEIIYDELTDGFRQPWHGDVWLSPPLGFENDGSSKQSKWFLAAEKKYANGEISSAMILLKTDFGCSWFLRVQNYPHVIFNNRLCFRTPTGREKGLQDESHVLVYMWVFAKRSLIAHQLY